MQQGVVVITKKDLADITAEIILANIPAPLPAYVGRDINAGLEGWETPADKAKSERARIFNNVRQLTAHLRDL